MSEGTLIGEGRMAEVFEWGDDQVLKLFRAWCRAEWPRQEAQVARTVHATGLAVPAVGDVIEVDGRWGIMYERVDGVSMLQCLTSKPWAVTRLARTLAELQAAMHSLPARTTGA